MRAVEAILGIAGFVASGLGGVFAPYNTLNSTRLGPYSNLGRRTVWSRTFASYSWVFCAVAYLLAIHSATGWFGGKTFPETGAAQCGLAAAVLSILFLLLSRRKGTNMEGVADQSTARQVAVMRLEPKAIPALAFGACVVCAARLLIP
jgi:hypothetical protein